MFQCSRCQPLEDLPWSSMKELTVLRQVSTESQGSRLINLTKGTGVVEIRLPI
jgi:hypothetical protein